jgi:hypothetical protein
MIKDMLLKALLKSKFKSTPKILMEGGVLLMVFKEPIPRSKIAELKAYLESVLEAERFNYKIVILDKDVDIIPVNRIGKMSGYFPEREVEIRGGE